MKVTRNGCSMKQMAYARRIFGAQGQTKKDIARDVGYSTNVANSIKSHIENKLGFNNAMSQLAMDSNNLALAAMHEFKARGFEDFSNKDLVGALNAIGNAWSRFNDIGREKKPESENGNKLRTIVLQQIEQQQNITTQTILPPQKPPDTPAPPSPLPLESTPENDF